MIDTESRERTAVVVSFLLTVSVAFAGAGVVGAQESPGQPHNFYGGVGDDGGTPAPTGAEIFALIDGEVEDSIVVEETGRYGGEGAFEDKLTVNDGAGDEVVFTVGSADGPESLGGPYSLSELEGGVTELDLTFPEGTFGSEPAAFHIDIDETASDLDAEANGTLVVEATVENVGGEGTGGITASVGGVLVGSEELTLAGGASETVTFEFEADPEYDGEPVEVASGNDSDTATLTVTDSGDDSLTETPTNGSAATPTPTATEAPVGGGGGGGGGSGDDGSASAVVTDTGVTVNFRNLGIDEAASASLEKLTAEDGASAVTELAVRSRFGNTDFRVELTAPREQPPGGTPGLDGDGRTAVSYFTAASFNVENSNVAAATFRFSLSAGELPDGVSPDDVRLFRYDDGEWVALETTALGEDKFSAESPGFSAFAIGYRNPAATATPSEGTAADTATGTVTATGTEDTETEPRGTTSTDSPGFGSLTALAALIAAAVLVTREE